MIARTSVPALPVSLLCLGLLHPALAPAAEASAGFVESRGCRVLGSERSIRRLREIAGQGSVTWDGECRNGLIHGPGSLRHQGSTSENDRTRNFAFYLNGTAKAGRRDGDWRRESFNMFEGSNQYWTSLTAIPYVDGVARDPLTPLQVRGKADFTPAFRALLDGVERKLAMAQNRDTAAASANPLPASAAAAQASVSEAKAAGAVREPATQSAKPPASAASQPLAPRSAPATAIPATSAAPVSSVIASRAAPQPAASPAGPATAEAQVEVESRLPGNRLNPYGSTAMLLGQITPPLTQERRMIAQTRACAVETINDASAHDQPIAVAQAEALRISGWAADPRAARIPEKAWIRLYGNRGGPGLLIDLARNAERPDVARSLGDPAYANAGFRLELAPGRLPTGDYTVAIIQQLGDELAVCQAMAKLRIR